jgi:parallel beta-helix repeat protein
MTRLRNWLSAWLPLFLFASGLVVAAAEPTCPPSSKASACIQQAVDTLTPNGGVIRLSAGEYILDTPLQLNRDSITLEGVGSTTVLKRGVLVENGEGVVNVRAKRITLRGFRFDGDVLEPTGIPYVDPVNEFSVHGAPIYSNPMHPELLRNTGITIHGNTSNVRLEDLEIQHTGGYAILIDARYGSISNVEMRRLHLRDNRPHLFGNPNDLRYGSWTGGIHYQNDGRDLEFARHALRGLTIEDSTFERISGHAIWGHGYGFQTLNEDVVIRRCQFTDIGLDGVLIGNTRRAVVEHNHFHRIGYTPRNGGGRPRPAWFPGFREDRADNIPAVGIDTSGLVSESVYQGNTMLNVNGNCIDLDGFTRGDVLHNSMQVSGRADAWNYINDLVDEFGPAQVGNYTKGINLSNTAGATLTESVRIVGNTIMNLGGYGIFLYDSQRCLVEDNHIRHYSLIFPPIILANSLREPQAVHQSRENIVRNNYVYFYPNVQCIGEADDIGDGDLPVVGPNYVYANTCDQNRDDQFLPGKQSGSRDARPPTP